MRSETGVTSALLLGAFAFVAGCAKPAFDESLPSQNALAGTYSIDAGPVASGDSSVIEVVVEPGGAWGRWVRFGNHREVGVGSLRRQGDTLFLDVVAGQWRGPMQLVFIGSEFTGTYRRGSRSFDLRGRKRADTVSTTMRAMAALRPYAPGILSTDTSEAYASLTPSGDEVYFTRLRPDWSGSRIVVARSVDGSWRPAEPLPFSTGEHHDSEPRLSPDGRQLLFSSRRPRLSGAPTNQNADIWMVTRREDGGWGDPVRLDAPVNADGDDFSPVVTGDGTLYFISTRPADTTMGAGRHVWRARRTPDGYAPPERMPPAVSSGYETNVFVTPDGRFMLVSRDGAPDAIGGDDLYISERRGDSWTLMRHLPPPLNSFEYEYGPTVAEKFLYFTSHRRGNGDLYRVPVESALAPASGAASPD